MNKHALFNLKQQKRLAESNVKGGPAAGSGQNGPLVLPLTFDFGVGYLRDRGEYGQFY